MLRQSRRAATASASSAVYAGDGIVHADDTSGASGREEGAGREESRGLLSAEAPGDGQQAGKEDELDPVPPYEDAIGGSTTAGRPDSVNIDISGSRGREAEGGLPIAGMSLGVSIPAIAPLIPTDSRTRDYFGQSHSSSRSATQARYVPQKQTLPEPQPQPYTRHPGDAGHSVWQNNTPKFEHSDSQSTLRGHPNDSDNDRTTDHDQNHLGLETEADAGGWMAPSPSASPSRHHHHLGARAERGMSWEDGRGTWGSPTGDSPRRERNWARRAGGNAGNNAG